MVAIQIRDVPDATRDILAREAERHDQSLQAYLMEILRRAAAGAKNRELLEEWQRNPLGVRGGDSDTVEIIRRGREERDRNIVEALSDYVPPDSGK